MVVILFLAFGFLSGTASADEPMSADILIIHSYHPSFEWTKTLHEGMIDALDSRGLRINLSVEYMDTKRIYSTEHIAGLVTLYQAKYRDSPPDVIVSSDNNAFRMLYENREKIFGAAVPVVFCGVNFFDSKEWPGMTNIVGVDERPDIGATLAIIDRLYPDEPPIAMLYDRSVTGLAYQKGYEQWLRGQDDKSRFHAVGEGYPEEILDEIRRMPEDAILYYFTYARDPGGEAYPPDELLVRIAEEHDIPVFGNYMYMMGQGIIGGPVIYGYDQGVAAVEMAMEIIEGRRNPGEFELRPSPYTLFFDHEPLKKAGFSERDLPEGSQVFNVPQAFWKEYPAETILAVLVAAVLVSGLAVTSRLLRHRAILLTEISHLNAELEDRVNRRSEALHRAEKELMRNEKLAALGSLVAGITHEVNTPLGLGVTGASYLKDRINSLRTDYQAGELSTSDFEDFLSNGSELSRMIEMNLHRAAKQISNFKQVAVDQTGEMPRLFDMAGSLEEFLVSMKNELKRTRIRVETECPPGITLTHFPGDIWRILANLLMNSLRHGYAVGDEGLVRIVVSRADDGLHLVFSDDGLGIPEEHLERIFDPYFTTARESGGSGLGLHLVRSIVVDRHGGSIDVRNRPSGGAEFHIRLPIRSPAIPGD